MADSKQDISLQQQNDVDIEAHKSLTKAEEYELVEEEKKKNPQGKAKTKRVASLDIFRGLTVALMVLVDDAGGEWPVITHAPWNGCNLADFVMPFFLFIVGVAIALALKRIPSSLVAVRKVIFRTIKLIFWGLLLQGGYSHAPDNLTYGVDMKKIRWFGILQRIALAYLVVALLEISTRKTRPEGLPHQWFSIFKIYMWHWVLGACVLIIYLAVLYGTYVPDWQFTVHNEASTEFGKLLTACTYSSPGAGPFRSDAPTWCLAPFEPEGILSSISAILSTVIGVHFGHVLIHIKDHSSRLSHWVAMGLALLALGIILHFTDAIPLNKQLYTFSYVCVTAGAAALVFSACYVLVDIWNLRFLFLPLEWIGMNAMFVYVMAAGGIFAGFINGWYYEDPHNTLVHWIQKHIFVDVWHSRRVGILLQFINQSNKIRRPIMATPMAEDSNFEEDQLLSMSTEDIVRASRLLDNEIRIIKEELQRTNLELDSFKEKIKENQEKIKLNKQLPYLVGNIVEILEMNPEEEAEEDGANIDLDSQRKGKCVVLKTSTRQTIFLPVVGLVDPDKLKPGDLVGVNKDSYLILDTLPSEYDSRVKAMEVDEKPTEDYNDIGGLEKQIQELVEAIVLPMTHKERFQKLGIRPPKGVLLYGPPGTGKTLMARACAAQTNATFLKLAGPQLVQMFIGDGAKLVRDAFQLAKEKSPCIIFIDEIDAIGTKRFDSEVSGDREVQRTMLELLNQLDGFSSDERIKVIAATNRADILDPALMRSGRLDRKIEFPHPTEEARARILQIHSRKMNVNHDVNFDELARSTEDFNGAQLKAVCVEAGMLALRRDATEVNHEDFNEGIIQVQAKKKASLNYYA
ncbi:OLC1v1001902C1 [Oldenlandia corymbosa var. corymbosa]|uniref:OLC1v1001902C1 n=1 Tax=Oldenlandia corymbosa var. corymbosa TaxID=529605 RepID=A0AAV1D728_OLDCO|nr:OLC1v1001902C1 [Oldenlandia corymbosa var. corymbosa]